MTYLCLQRNSLTTVTVVCYLLSGNHAYEKHIPSIKHCQISFAIFVVWDERSLGLCEMVMRFFCHVYHKITVLEVYFCVIMFGGIVLLSLRRFSVNPLQKLPGEHGGELHLWFRAEMQISRSWFNQFQGVGVSDQAVSTHPNRETADVIPAKQFSVGSSLFFFSLSSSSC